MDGTSRSVALYRSHSETLVVNLHVAHSESRRHLCRIPDNEKQIQSDYKKWEEFNLKDIIKTEQSKTIPQIV
jgi:hypothetical protein